MRKDALLRKLDAIITEYKNDEFAEFYDFEIVEENGQVFVVDHTEESYYERWMLKKFVQFLEPLGMYLECECPGRYLVAC